MPYATTRFGELVVPSEEIVEFPAGLPGFEAVHRFVTIEDQATEPFVWLQALDQPDLAFLTINPALLIASYQPELSEEARRQLIDPAGGELEILAIVTVPDDHHLMTANLRAPLLINRQRRVGRQEVGVQGRYSFRHRIIPADPKTDAAARQNDPAAAGR